jgi:hypothetical protein
MNKAMYIIIALSILFGLYVANQLYGWHHVLQRMS